MGVRGLDRLRREKAPNSEIERNINFYKNTKQAIDASNYIYKFVISIRGSNGGYDMVTSDNRLVSHIYGIFYKTINILRYNITPCWVFDGAPPPIKNITIGERKKIKTVAQDKIVQKTYKDEEDKVKLLKRTFFITEKYIQECQMLLKLMGISYIQSVGEAEAQCAVLNISNKVYGVVTEDWDALPFGSLTMLKDFSNKKPIREVNLETFLCELDLTHEQFIELCILLGNDYSQGIKGIGSVALYEEYIKFKSIDKLLKYMRIINELELKIGNQIKYDIPPNFERTYKKAKDYYMNVRVVDPKHINVEWKEPKYRELESFLVNKFELDRNTVKKDIANLRNMYNKMNKDHSENSWRNKEPVKNKLGDVKNFTKRIKKTYFRNIHSNTARQA